LPHRQRKKILTSVTHVAEAAAVTADAQVVAMVAVAVTKETVAVDAQAAAMVAVVETASLATSQSAASIVHVKQQYFLGVAADLRVGGDVAFKVMWIKLAQKSVQV
jgi:hypothetical protein